MATGHNYDRQSKSVRAEIDEGYHHFCNGNKERYERCPNASRKSIRVDGRHVLTGKLEGVFSKDVHKFSTKPDQSRSARGVARALYVNKNGTVVFLGVANPHGDNVKWWSMIAEIDQSEYIKYDNPHDRRSYGIRKVYL
jgi:hypothetical protein